MDKIIHMVVFGILAYLGCYFYVGRKKSFNAAMIRSALPAILYGTSIEFMQMFIPQRGFDYADLTADVIGTIFGVLLFKLAIKKITNARAD